VTQLKTNLVYIAIVIVTDNLTYNYCIRKT